MNNDELNCGIYCILNIANCKLYIGSSVNLSARFRKHISELRRRKHHNQYLQNSFNKYGEENFVFVVLEFVRDEKRVTEIEQSYIELFSHNVLYNMNVNATNNLGLKRKSAAKNSKEVYQFTIDGKLIKCWNSIDEAAATLNLSYRNIMNMCQKTKMKVNGVTYFTKSVGGFVWSYNKNYITPQYKNKKKVGQYTIDGTFIKEYESTTDAQKQLKFTRLHVSDVCKGKRKSSGGFIWKYVE